MLHLQHDALVGLVDARRLLRHHAVEAGALEAAEPVAGRGTVARRRREVERRRCPRQQGLERRAPLLERRHSAGRDRLRTGDRKTPSTRVSPWTASRRATPPGEDATGAPRSRALRADDDDLAIEHAAFRQLFLQGLDELGVVAAERLCIAALNEDLISVAEHQGAKPVPLGLEDPPLAVRQLTGRLGKHGQDRRIHGQTHCGPSQASALSDTERTGSEPHYRPVRLPCAIGRRELPAVLGSAQRNPSRCDHGRVDHHSFRGRKAASR